MTGKYDFQAIKAKVDMFEIAVKYIPGLKRSGNIYKGKCPIHDDGKPSFVVYDDGFHCFGCLAHGDVIDFMVAMEGGTKGDAIARLGAGDFTLTPSEKRIVTERHRARDQEREEAIAMAVKRWNEAPPASDDNGYLERKMVRPHMARLDGKSLLVPVYDRDGEIQNVQTIDRDGGKLFQWGAYLKDDDGNFVLSPEGKKLRGSGAPAKGGRLNFGICIGRSIVCEGFATGASIYEAIPDRVAVGFSKSGVIDLVRELHGNGQEVAIASDRNALPEMLALGLELGIPVYAPAEPHDDFNDMAVAIYNDGYDPSDAIKAILNGPPIAGPVHEAKPIERFDAANDSASDPVDIWARNVPPEMPRGILPPIIERAAFQAASLSGADPGGYAMGMLCTAGAAITDRIRLKMKNSEDWWEQARIWVMIIGEPSYKKSPIMRTCTRALAKIDSTMVREYEKAAAAYSEDDSGDPPVPKRLRIDDITMEAAQEVARHSPDGILAMQDELSGWFGGIEKYSGNKGSAKDKSFWLRAFGGGEYAVNRIGRKSFLIDNLSISVFGGIQPDAIRRVMADATEDGLIQRFFAVLLRPANIGTDDLPNDAVREYDALIDRLNTMGPPTNFFGERDLIFDAEGQALRSELEVKHFGMVRAMEAVNKRMASHLGKFDGMFGRLCVIWHMIESANLDAVPEVIPVETVQRVARFLHEYVLRHSMSFYTTLIGVSEDQDAIEDVAGYILAHGVEKVTLRTFHHGSTRMRKLTRQIIEPICHQLEALGWIDKIDARATQFVCQVNPRVHEVFKDRAESERVRRDDVKAKIQGMVGPEKVTPIMKRAVPKR